MRNIILVSLVVFLAYGCAETRTLGLKTGVIKPAETITLPLNKLREFEAAFYDRQTTLLNWKDDVCMKSASPATSCKLPSKMCEGITEERHQIIDAHRQIATLLYAPDLVEVDGARILDLLIKATGAAASAMK